jgi:diaminopimelate epimerase
MGIPVFEPAKVPFQAESDSVTHNLEIAGRTLEVSTLAIGNPHAVTYVDNLHDFPVLEYGPQVEAHERFPNRVNAGFAQRISENELRVRVYERGVGETIACGTGACAAVIAGVRRGILKGKVMTHLSGGSLEISWAGEGEPVMMTGPAKTVFHGQINI